MCSDRAEVGQPMNGLNINRAPWRIFRRGLEVCHQVAGPDRCECTMVDVYQVWSGRGHLAAIERGVYVCNRRPSLCYGGRYAGEITGDELRGSGIEVVGVEHDKRRNPL